MSLRTAVQALNRVGALARQRGDASVAALHPSFKALVSLLYSRVADMNPIQLCNTLVTLSQLKVEIAQPVLTSFAEVASSKAGNFWPRDISMFIYALAQLRGTPSRECLDRLCFRAVVSEMGTPYASAHPRMQTRVSCPVHCTSMCAYSIFLNMRGVNP